MTADTIARMARRMAAFRLTEDVHALLAELARRMGISQADVVELAVRWMDAHERAVRAGETGGAHVQTTEDPDSD